MNDILQSFSPPVREWFAETFGEPTPPQAQGWPAIQRGEHTLVLAPTGSGKTMAAFLWGIDQLFRELAEEQADEVARKQEKSGVRILYVSPLKALNNDIHRNLRAPLAGVRKKAQQLGLSFPHIQTAIRSGDTPQRERRAMASQPPHILITTPESLYLMLTSPRLRDIFRTVRVVIVDEIHTLAGNKRGVHLSLSLERLQHLANHPIQRIGLSATIQPLGEVAHFLGGNEWTSSPHTASAPGVMRIDNAHHVETSAKAPISRPVTIVDAGYHKTLDLQVETVVEDFQHLPGDSIWPAIIPRVLQLIRQHETTLIFTNNRRLAERTADRLNEQISAEAQGVTSGVIEHGVAKGIGFMAAGTGSHSHPIRAHHGSMAKEARLQMERDLKAGKLPALVGTSSLELGIDIGSIDLVVQLQSPKSVAQGLQRIGRSGHLVGQTSKGRIFPTHREDVMEAAAIAKGILRDEVEPTYTPQMPLDVLAQHIVAMVSVETWSIDEMFNTVRGAYAYQDLTPRVFHTVLEMLAGRYPGQAYRELRARLAWDRVNHKLSALPGSRMAALTNGGTIPDRGSFSTYLPDGKTRLGDLDEEFVFETRVGDTFMLGSQVWRVIDISDDKVMVTEAPGAPARMPFWRGDYPWRPYELGKKVGEFRRRVAERLEQLQATMNLREAREIRDRRQESEVQAALAWLQEDSALDKNSAWQVLNYVASQIDKAGAISSDRTVIVEVFDDALGDPRMVVQAPFGGRVNGPWGLALAGALRERTGVNIEVQSNDDGILLRFPDADAEFPLDIVTEMGPAEARERILRELPDSAVFGARFRQNAARALLLPGLRGGKRTPFWLQRLRAKDLLQIVRQFEDFPIIAETYRDCLQDVMDLPHLEEVLRSIQSGEIQVLAVESLTPSPVAQSLLWNFSSIYLYEGDTPKAERQLQTLSLSRELLQDLLRDIALDELLRPEAVQEIRARLQHTAPTSQARTMEELGVLLQEMGDLSSLEISYRSQLDPADWLAQLSDQRRILEMSIPTTHGPERRWVATEYVPEYRTAFGISEDSGGAGEAAQARRRILDRFLRHAGPVTLEEIQRRYLFPNDWLGRELDQLVESRQVAHGRFTPSQALDRQTTSSVDEFIDLHTLEQIHRRTLGILRREVRAVPFTAYADFLAEWQHLALEHRWSGPGALRQALQQLRAAPVVGQTWERDVLPLRLVRYDPAELEGLCQSGEVIWVGSGGVDPRRGRIRFLFRGEGGTFLEPAPEAPSALSPATQAIYNFLKSEGAVFFADIQAGLDMKDSEVEASLVELVMAGLVTNDSLDAMRRIVTRGAITTTAPQQEHVPFSSLEEQLAERLGGHERRLPPGVRRPRPAEYRAAKRRVRERLSMGEGPSQTWGGRWTLVHRFGVLGKMLPPEERAAQQARQLLLRYAIVTRDSLAREEGAWDWSLIYAQLQRMEMRGEVRRGYFVQALPGVQFALPEVIERLRAGATRAGTPIDQNQSFVAMNACDPANLYGPAMDFFNPTQQPPRPTSPHGQALTFSRIPSTWLVQHRGLPALIAEDTGARITTVQGTDEGMIRRGLLTLLGHLGRFQHRVTVETWNDMPVLESAGRTLLESVGFYRDYLGMTWEKP
jgi:ATP-dependent Lhr-like helicase